MTIFNECGIAIGFALGAKDLQNSINHLLCCDPPGHKIQDLPSTKMISQQNSAIKLIESKLMDMRRGREEMRRPFCMIILVVENSYLQVSLSNAFNSTKRHKSAAL